MQVGEAGGIHTRKGSRSFASEEGLSFDGMLEEESAQDKGGYVQVSTHVYSVDNEKKDDNLTRHVFQLLPHSQFPEWRWIQGPNVGVPSYAEGLSKFIRDAILYLSAEGHKVGWFRRAGGLPIDISIQQQGEKWHIVIVAAGEWFKMFQRHKKDLAQHLERKGICKQLTLTLEEKGKQEE